MNPEIVSFQYATGMCLLLENVGGSEQNRSVGNVQSDDLWPSRMHAATQKMNRQVGVGDSKCVVVSDLLLAHHMTWSMRTALLAFNMG